MTNSNTQYPPFGRSMRAEFLFGENYINLNHGAFGAYPRAVQNSLREFQSLSEANADLWFRRSLRPQLLSAREQVSALVNAEIRDIVFVPNDTTGINAVLRSTDWQKGDRILHFSTIYFGIDKLVRFICDSSKGSVTSLCFNVTYPISNDDLVTNLETFLDQNDDPQRPIRLAIVDHITSAPGVVVPIERIIPILRRRNILVMVDAAHAIGQISIDLTSLDPDYYTSNCHKWMYAARPCAILYVKKKHQAALHPPSISAYYGHENSFNDEFFWTGTIDYSPYLSVMAALEFRRAVGGEEAIREYTHRLAWEGGKYLAQQFGTEVLQVTEDQVGSIVDVRLPLDNPQDEKFNGDYFNNYISDILFEKYKVYSTSYKHGGKWWIRVSAQIYNDMEDIENEAKAFLEICQNINQGKL